METGASNASGGSVGEVRALEEELRRQRKLLAMKDLLYPQMLNVIGFQGPGPLNDQSDRIRRATCLLCKGCIEGGQQVYALFVQRLPDVLRGERDSADIVYIHADCFSASTGFVEEPDRTRQGAGD